MTQKKIDVTKPVQTRDGRKAWIICPDMRAITGFPSRFPTIVEFTEGQFDE